MNHPPIQNCKFEFDCPREFAKLETTDDPNVRFCQHCSCHVYHCNTLRELAKHSQAGHCVSLAIKPCDPSNTRHGDRVRITSGTFENFDAEIEEVDPQQNSASIMVNIFGRVAPIWVPLDTLGHLAE